jgi:plastocyanin
MHRPTRRPPLDAAPLFLLLALTALTPAAAQTVNGCSFDTATDWFDATPAERQIDFVCCSYTPACVKIEAGETVTFSGAFSSHPLRPGFTEGGPPAADPGSPILATSAGSTPVTFTFAEAGVDPFYCNNHFNLTSMYGAVFVVLFADGFENPAGVCDWDDAQPQGCP